MSAKKTAAGWAAYEWYRAQLGNAGCSDEQAVDFARENWRRFVPIAEAGFGKLLNRVIRQRQRATKFHLVSSPKVLSAA